MKGDIVLIGGAGHIGLPLGLLFANKGKKVILYDKDHQNINKIKSLKMPFMEEGGLKLLKRNRKRIYATTDKRFIKNAKIIIVCIGTPVKNNKPNLTPIISASEIVGSLLKKNNLGIYESTVFPGCTEEICVPILEKSSSLKYNSEFFAEFE